LEASRNAAKNAVFRQTIRQPCTRSKSQAEKGFLTNPENRTQGASHNDRSHAVDILHAVTARFFTPILIVPPRRSAAFRPTMMCEISGKASTPI
jgi:hypothetical protein